MWTLYYDIENVVFAILDAGVRIALIYALVRVGKRK